MRMKIAIWRTIQFICTSVLFVVLTSDFFWLSVARERHAKRHGIPKWRELSVSRYPADLNYPSTRYDNTGELVDALLSRIQTLGSSFHESQAQQLDTFEGFIGAEYGPDALIVFSGYLRFLPYEYFLSAESPHQEQVEELLSGMVSFLEYHCECAGIRVNLEPTAQREGTITVDYVSDDLLYRIELDHAFQPDDEGGGEGLTVYQIQLLVWPASNDWAHCWHKTGMRPMDPKEALSFWDFGSNFTCDEV